MSKTKVQTMTLFDIQPVPGPVAAPSERYFDIVRDNAQIASGTHFWCHSHLSAVPLIEQSPNPRYCLTCFENIRGEETGKTLPELTPAIPTDSASPQSNAEPLQREKMPSDMVNPVETDNSEATESYCPVCGVEVHAKRKDARFCSSACRLKAYRGAGIIFMR